MIYTLVITTPKNIEKMIRESNNVFLEAGSPMIIVDKLTNECINIAWPKANKQDVPWSEVHWSNHGRGDHANPHQHIFEFNPDKGGWIRGGPSYFSGNGNNG